MDRLAGIDGQTFDAVIIGGGIAGAGVARELALRGLSVVLVEKGDFASGTTSKTSKLIHGGLRYLELFDFTLVRESLRERQRLQRLASHLVRPLPFLVPIYRGGTRSLIKVRIGLRLYDLLTPGRSRHRSRTLSASDALRLEASLNPGGLLGAGCYVDDLLVFPERLCLENVLSARRLGATVMNYAQVEEFLPSEHGRRGLVVRDLLNGQTATVNGRRIINAAGPWVDQIRALAGVEDRGKRIVRTTKGIHILLPRMGDRALYLSAGDDRMIFVIPWRNFSLVGTTDTDFKESPDRCWATAEEVRYLLAEIQRALSDPRARADAIVTSYAGVRPLSWESGKPPSKVSRQHRVVAEGPDDELLSITGTKLTCYRSLAQRVGDHTVRSLGRGGPSRSASVALDGTDEDTARIEIQTWLNVEQEMRASGLSREQIEYLVELYGRNSRAILTLARELPDGASRLCEQNPDIAAQLHHAVSQELTCSLQDFLMRRSGIGQSGCQGVDCAPAIGRRMAAMLGWSSRRLEAELSAYEEIVQRNLRFRSELLKAADA